MNKWSWIFVIYICSIKMILDYIVCQIIRALQWISSLCIGLLCSPESWDQESDSFIVKGFFNVVLNFFISSSKLRLISTVVDWIIPELSHIKGSWCAGPKGKGEMIIFSLLCMSRHSNPTHYTSRWPPFGDAIHICKLYRVLYFSGGDWNREVSQIIGSELNGLNSWSRNRWLILTSPICPLCY